MNIIKSFFNVVVALTMGVAATAVMQAQGLPIDYCSGYIATSAQGNITGLTGSNATISMAVQFPADYLAEYVGTQVTSLRVGLPEVSAYPETMSLWLSTARDAEPLVMIDVSELGSGWVEAPLTQPVSIAPEQELWVGANYTQSTKLNIISFAGQTDAHACFVARNGNWTDYSSRNFGSLSLGMRVSGDNLASHDLTLSEVTANQRMLRPGAMLSVSGIVANQGSVQADVIALDCMADGNVIDTQYLRAPLAFGQSLPFTVGFAMPATEQTTELTIAAHWDDGSVDEHPADNLATLPVVLNAATPYRQMVVEEGTGTWCGYCVRGIVGMNQMSQQHPDRFVGIAVHCNDEFPVADYSDYIYAACNGGLPGATINRDGTKYNPHPDNLEAYLSAMPAFAEMEVKPMFSIEGQQLTMQADVSFLAAQTATDYRLALVLLEDSLTAVQTNYYAGGDEGPMAGFENQDKYVVVQLMDVARAIYPSVAGAEQIIPANIEAGQTFSYELTEQLPSAIVNADHLRLAALLIDGATGRIVQAGKTGYYHNAQAIELITDSERPNGNSYDLFGRRSAGQQGLTIRDRQKSIILF